MKNLRTILLMGAAALITGALVAQAQVPGVNSTLNSVFTLAYDNSTMKPTYSSLADEFTLASAATDVCTLQGSATKTIKVRRVFVSGWATAVGTEPVELIKRSTAATTGTSVVDPIISYDSINVASGAQAEHYTANPTVGTAVGPILQQQVTFANLSTGVGTALIAELGERGQPVVLRGVAQNIAVNMLAQTVTGGKLTCGFEWTEE